MGFSLPTFNISCNVWHLPNTPPAAPDSTEDCNLAFGRRVSSYQGVISIPNEPIMSLLLPPGTDVRGPQCGTGGDVIEVPSGTGRFYTVVGLDDSGKGFTNEHRVALLAWTADYGAWPAPIP
jgi:hypothetical protein